MQALTPLPCYYRVRGNDDFAHAESMTALTPPLSDSKRPYKDTTLRQYIVAAGAEAVSERPRLIVLVIRDLSASRTAQRIRLAACATRVSRGRCKAESPAARTA